ncbi:MAG: AraC family transcriptional regulator [Gammaproteobacteria bacterium]|nr:AraC family transcriptional regulator [Gammaproteobacteria bacterium]
MQFRAYVPRAPLCEFVEDFWLYEDYAGEHLRERILPSGTFEMVFNLREDELRIYGSSEPHECRRFAGAVISGPYAGSFISDTVEEAAILGVHFKPGGAFAVLGLPAGDLTNAHVDLRLIWGPAATTLRERLCAMSEPISRFRLLEEALLERLLAPSVRHRAVLAGLDLLARSHGQVQIRDIATAVNLSPRRFTQAFTAEVGLTPKLFGRVQRFQYAAASARKAATVDWALLAVECGYFDQSHLIHEFVQFSGLTPAEYWRRLKALDRSGAHVKRHHLPMAD